MKRSNLVEIDERLERAVERQIESPEATTAMKMGAKRAALHLIAGFDVVDPKGEADQLRRAVDERREELKRYQSDRDLARQAMTDRGIDPLAIVPKTAWTRLCERSGLFMIEPDGNNKIRISLEKLDTFEKHAVRLGGFLMVTGSILLYAGTSFGAWMIWGGWIAPILTLTIIGLCYWTVFGYKTSHFGGLFKWFKQKLTLAQIRLFTLRRWPTILKTLRAKPNQQSRITLVRIHLPEPPPEVQATLLKVKNLHLQVAAEARAIRFAEPPYELLKRLYLEEEQARREEEERRARLRADPIVFYEHGSAVVVIAQFGDFPIEQKVVDEVVATTDYLL